LENLAISAAMEILSDKVNESKDLINREKNHLLNEFRQAKETISFYERQI
jgi:hypothetical protein